MEQLGGFTIFLNKKHMVYYNIVKGIVLTTLINLIVESSVKTGLYMTLIHRRHWIMHFDNMFFALVNFNQNLEK